jgi:hypothetical protein
MWHGKQYVLDPCCEEWHQKFHPEYFMFFFLAKRVSKGHFLDFFIKLHLQVLSFKIANEEDHDSFWVEIEMGEAENEWFCHLLLNVKYKILPVHLLSALTKRHTSSQCGVRSARL